MTFHVIQTFWHYDYIASFYGMGLWIIYLPTSLYTYKNMTYGDQLRYADHTKRNIVTVGTYN